MQPDILPDNVLRPPSEKRLVTQRYCERPISDLGEEQQSKSQARSAGRTGANDPAN